MLHKVASGHSSDEWFGLQSQIRNAPSKNFKIRRAENESTIRQRFEECSINLTGARKVPGESVENKNTWIESYATACDENGLRYFQALHG